MRQDGSKVTDSVKVTSFQNMSNILTAMEQVDSRNGEAVQQLKTYLENKESGYVIFNNEIEKYINP